MVWKAVSVVALAGWVVVSSSARPAVAEFEATPVFEAAELLPAESLSGPGYRVATEVTNDGFLNHYTILTDEGEIQVAGTDLMAVRLREMNAIHALDQVEQTDTFVEAAGKAATSPFRFVANMVSSPIDTTGAVIGGVGSFFGSIGHSLFGGASEEEENVAKVILGVDAIKRGVAGEFGVDPYSSNGLLQARLDKVGWTAFAGGVGPKAVFALVPGGVSLALKTTSFSGDMSQLIVENTPAALKAINRDKLAAMDVNEDTVGLFLEHPKYSPTRKTFIVGALKLMDGVDDREAFIEAALLADTINDAFSWQRKAEMYAGYHLNVKPGRRFVRVVVDAVLQDADGKLVEPVPSDYVVWTEPNQDRADASMGGSATEGISGVTGQELWLAGGITALARENVEQLGWTVVADTRDRLRLP